MRPTRLALVLAVTSGLVLLLAVDQVLQHTALDDGWVGGRRMAPFDPPLFGPEQRAALEAMRALAEQGRPLSGNVTFDAELGWAPLPLGGRGPVTYDVHGARVGGRGFPPADGSPGADAGDADLRRLVLAGGSFTHGDEVAGEQTWGARLTARVPDLAVANLGVGGYGVDQAWLRLRRDGLPLRPDDVWLGVLPGAALRLVNVYRPALRHHDHNVAFKPRFRLDAEGVLELLPCPVRSPAELVALVEDTGAFFEAVGRHDLFVARHPAAYMPMGAHWSHRFAASRAWLTRQEGRQRDAGPWLADARSEPARLLDALVLAIADEVTGTGARFAVVLLGDRRALAAAAARNPDGPTDWDGRVAAWRAAGVVVLDPSDALLAAGALDDDAFWAPGGHHAPPAHAVLAEALAPHLIATSPDAARADDAR